MGLLITYRRHAAAACNHFPQPSPSASAVRLARHHNSKNAFDWGLAPSVPPTGQGKRKKGQGANTSPPQRNPKSLNPQSGLNQKRSDTPPAPVY